MRAIIALVGLVILGLLIAMLSAQELNPLSTPGDIVEDPSKVMAAFREARDNSANLVAIAKAELDRVGKRGHLKEGRRLPNWMNFSLTAQRRFNRQSLAFW